MPSLPGLPLFSLTRLSAARQFWRSTTSSIRPPMPERPSPRPAGAASTRAAGPAASPPALAARPNGFGFCGMASPRDEVVSHFSSFGPSPGQARRRSRLALLLVRSFAGASPATMTSADFSPPRYAASPFQAQEEISPGKSLGLRGAAAGSTPPCLGHESFAITCSLALRSDAFYPVPVRRPAASRPASFTLASRSNALRFASLAVTSSREDLHLQVDAHAGRTGRIASPAARNDGWARRLAMTERTVHFVSSTVTPSHCAGGGTSIRLRI